MRHLNSLLLLRGALLKALDAAGLIESTIFARIEGVALRRDLDDEFRVLFALKGDYLGGLYGRTNEELLARGDIFKNDGAVPARVDILFHPVRNNINKQLLQTEIARR